MTASILRELKRLNITRPVAPAAASSQTRVDPMSFLVPGYSRALTQDVRPEVEIGAWFAVAPKAHVKASAFWDEKGDEWPLLKALAIANFVAQAANAGSERVWSAADDISGGDRSRIAPETLNDQLILKKNTKVRAKLEGCSLFAALGAK